MTLIQRPRPIGSGGSCVDTAWGNPICGTPRGQLVSRRGSGVTETFHFQDEMKVVSILSLLLFLWNLCQHLKRSWCRKYSLILPASPCSRRRNRNRSYCLFTLVKPISLFAWWARTWIDTPGLDDLTVGQWRDKRTLRSKSYRNYSKKRTQELRKKWRIVWD